METTSSPPKTRNRPPRLKGLLTPWWKPVLIALALLVLVPFGWSYGMYKLLDETRLDHSAVLDMDLPVTPEDYGTELGVPSLYRGDFGEFTSGFDCKLREIYKFHTRADLQTVVSKLNANPVRWGSELGALEITDPGEFDHNTSYIVTKADGQSNVSFFAQYIATPTLGSQGYYLHLCEIQRS